MQLVQLLASEPQTDIAFQRFEAERRPRVEKIVALARRNGNNKREFSRTGAWIRNQMIKFILPLSARSQDWVYGYNAGDLTTRRQTSGQHNLLAA